ncbi:AI-2E family transporter [Limimaricola hongkongensis]|uniref:Putative membrane protein n=1 Tax=Limimaricola hongkongensis DSM 17492 TaxID=1122180 RepID=A0A017H7Q5_9RHOB|nr:AI-2E family transporter [Limimaricola hongkongensis]EYD70411.1 putative membrane protein [Limimaricola hongkongensis DSM 17492]
MSDKAPETENRAASVPQRLAHPALGLLALIALVIAGWALHAMRPVFLPITFALFLALLLAPVQRGAARLAGGRRWVGHVAAMAALGAALAVFLAVLWLSAQQFLVRFPAQEAQQAIDQLSQAPDGAGRATGQVASEATGAAVESAIQATPGAGIDPGSAPSRSDDTGSSESLVAQIRGMADGGIGGTLVERASGLATTVVSMISGILLALVLIFFLTLLMLIEAPRWQRKLSAMTRSDTRDEVLGAVDVVAGKIRRYLGVRLVLGLLTGALYAGWLWLFGVDLLLVWALLAFVLNFVPSVGSLISGVLAVIYAFAIKEPGTAVLIGAGLLVIEQVMGNYVDPRVQGRQLSISALVILSALLFWGWIWGVAGAILAVPITMAVMVVCAHVPPLRWIALALSDETDYAGIEARLGAPDPAGARR